ncbi:MAG: hypothetical protein QM605_04935 [Sphingobium sp.]
MGDPLLLLKKSPPGCGPPAYVRRSKRLQDMEEKSVCQLESFLNERENLPIRPNCGTNTTVSVSPMNEGRLI